MQPREAGAATINYGVFVNTVLDFVIVALAIFMVIKAMNRLKTQGPPKPPNTKSCPHCISDIPVAATRCKFCTSEVE